MNSVVLSVVYPGAERYISEFLNSLSRQTDKDFSLFLVNDGLGNIQDFLKGLDFDIQILEGKGSTAELRKLAIEWAISKEVETIIFADADDYFSDNRVEVSKRMLNDYDVVCNEILLIGENISYPIPMFGKLFEDREEVVCADIVKGNCMGLSNTAVHTKNIPSCIKEIPNDIIAFDWALFALCLYSGAKSVFTKETKTYYRQHDNNLASPLDFSEDHIMMGVKVKKDHYRVLSSFYDEYVFLANTFESLSLDLEKDKALKQRYCQAVKQQGAGNLLWWDPIKSLEDFGL